MRGSRHGPKACTVMDDGTEQQMMEGDTGDQWTSAVSALFIRIHQCGRITLPLGGRAALLKTRQQTPTVTLFFSFFLLFLLNQAVPDEMFPPSVWIHLV